MVRGHGLDDVTRPRIRQEHVYGNCEVNRSQKFFRSRVMLETDLHAPVPPKFHSLTFMSYAIYKFVTFKVGETSRLLS